MGNAKIGEVWGPAVMFREPVDWSDPFIADDPDLPTLDGPRSETRDGLWGPAILFRRPAAWPDPVIVHDPEMPVGRGYRVSVYRSLHEDRLIRAYTRGLCHAYATANVLRHGGLLVALMHRKGGRDHVAHVMSAHDTDGMALIRDICGDHFHVGDPFSLTPEDFGEISERHLLGIRIDEVRVVGHDPWVLPCDAPTRDEIRDALEVHAGKTPPAAPDFPDAEAEGPSGP